MVELTGSTPGNLKGEIMGTVYRKTATKPLPAGAKLIVRKGQRLAEWKDAKGKTRTAPLTTGQEGQPRIVIEAGTYTAKYRDGSGIVQEVATGCRDETAARSVLADLERRAEMVKGKVLTATEDALIDHQETPLAEHLEGYLVHLKAKGDSDVHLSDTRRLVGKLIGACCFARLAKADERADRRRQRRAMTEDELTRLLDVARRRPLAEYGRLAASRKTR